MMSSTFALQQGKASRQDKQGRSSGNSPTPVMPPGSQHSSCPLCSTGLSSSPEDLHSHTSGLCVPHAQSPGVQPKGAGCSPLLLLLGAAQHSTAGCSKPAWTPFGFSRSQEGFLRDGSLLQTQLVCSPDLPTCRHKQLVLGCCACADSQRLQAVGEEHSGALLQRRCKGPFKVNGIALV